MSEEEDDDVDGKIKITPGWCSQSKFTFYTCSIISNTVYCLGFKKLKEKLDSRANQTSTVTGRFQAAVLSKAAVGSVVFPDGTPSWAVDPQYRTMEDEDEDEKEESFSSNVDLESPWELSDTDK